MNPDVKLIVGVGLIVGALFGSAWIVSHVMIRLTDVVRTDLQELRDSLEHVACGEFARRADTDPWACSRCRGTPVQRP